MTSNLSLYSGHLTQKCPHCLLIQRIYSRLQYQDLGTGEAKCNSAVFFIYIIHTYAFPAVTCYNFQQKGLICFGGVT